MGVDEEAHVQTGRGREALCLLEDQRRVTLKERVNDPIRDSSVAAGGMEVDQHHVVDVVRPAPFDSHPREFENIFIVRIPLGITLFFGSLSAAFESTR